MKRIYDGGLPIYRKNFYKRGAKNLSKSWFFLSGFMERDPRCENVHHKIISRIHWVLQDLIWDLVQEPVSARLRDKTRLKSIQSGISNRGPSNER